VTSSHFACNLLLRLLLPWQFPPSLSLSSLSPSPLLYLSLSSPLSLSLLSLSTISRAFPSLLILNLSILFYQQLSFFLCKAVFFYLNPFILLLNEHGGLYIRRTIMLNSIVIKREKWSRYLCRVQEQDLDCDEKCIREKM
jgi:hypothetical protein